MTTTNEILAAFDAQESTWEQRMKETPKVARFEGLAATHKLFRHRGRDVRIAKTAFDGWLKTNAERDVSSRVPLRFKHRRSPLPCDGIYFKHSRDGLRVVVRIDVRNPLGQAAALAVEHGFINRLSLGLDHESAHTFDGYRLISRTRPVELSLCDNPAIKETYLTADGKPPTGEKTWPTNDEDAAILQHFLASLGIEHKLQQMRGDIAIHAVQRRERHEQNKCNAEFGAMMMAKPISAGLSHLTLPLIRRN